MGTLREILHNNQFQPEDVPKFEAKLYYEGARLQPYLVRYSVLLVTSTIISTMGVLGDSTATVIGAMIIAPLMTPIMATTAALLTGQSRRAIRSTLLVVISVTGVIALAWFFSAFYLWAGQVISFDTNSQITGRITPRLLDLIAALASGTAGAFAMSRDDIADSLAGVAISISLVPPLCVVGIGLAGGEWSASSGAMLLFLTNYLSILLAGGAVLAILGLAQAANAKANRRARRRAYILIAAAALIVMIPLAATGARMGVQSVERQQTKTLTTDWVSGTGYSVEDVQIDFVTGTVDISIIGTGEPPALSDLGPQLEALFQKPIEVDLDIIPANSDHYPEPDPDESSSA